MSWVQVWTVIAAVAGITGLQGYWVSRSLTELRREMERGFDQIDRRLARIEDVIVGHNERITRLEAQQ
jgi:hypothetical protein